MATQASLSKDYQNKVDNADFTQENSARDIAASYVDVRAMEIERSYLETLKMRHDLLNIDGGKLKTWRYDPNSKEWAIEKIDVDKLVQRPTEFEGVRLNVLIKLNTAKPEELKRLFAYFETDSIFELSSRMTNMFLHTEREQEVYKTWSWKS